MIWHTINSITSGSIPLNIAVRRTVIRQMDGSLTEQRARILFDNLSSGDDDASDNPQFKPTIHSRQDMTLPSNTHCSCRPVEIRIELPTNMLGISFEAVGSATTESNVECRRLSVFD